MSFEWREVRLGDIAKIKGGKRLPKGVNLLKERNNHPYIRIRDLGISKSLILNDNFEYVDEETQKKISRYIVSTDDVILSIVGTIGLVSKVDRSLMNANLTENCVKITELSNLNNDFLYYYLISEKGQNEIRKGTVGAVQPKLPIKNILSIKVYLPDIQFQKIIATTLSCLDDKIELNNHMNKTLEEMAQAIFKSWFVDFEPFQDGEFFDSKLGMIPKGWKAGTLSDICSYNGNRISVQSLSLDTYISTENMLPNKAGYVRASSLPSISQTTKFCKRDILISNIRPYFKKIVFCDHEGGCSTDVLCLASKRLQFASFTYFVVFANKFFDFMMAGSKGTKMPRGDKKQIMQYKIVIPSDSSLTTFDNIINPFLLQINQNKIEMDRLSSLRDTLLPKLMSGEIRVPVQEDKLYGF